MKVLIEYTNWEGIRRQREIIPTGVIKFASTQWHPKEQWLLEATDVESGEVKLFAMRDIHGWDVVSKKPDYCPKCGHDRNPANEHERDGTYLCWCVDEEEEGEATVPEVRHDEVPGGLRRDPDGDPQQD